MLDDLYNLYDNYISCALSHFLTFLYALNFETAVAERESLAKF